MRRVVNSVTSRALRRGATTCATAAIAAIALASTALAAQTPIVAETFTHTTTTSTAWVLPAAPVGVNSACLTASGDTSQTPIPGCGLGSPDPDGSGALQLTSANNSEEGGVAFGQTLPTTKGLDVRFDTYQYGGNGADGIGFFLAATDPTAPGPPSNIGQPGGDLGYASGGGTGLADAYLGIGIDVYGNYANGLLDGSGCTDPSWVVFGSTIPGQVTVRGPGNGTVGYCPLTSTAATDGGAPQALDGGGGTRASSLVPVEIVINPGAAPVTTTSGLTVPAHDYEVAFTPLGGALQSFTDVLPTTANGEIPAGTIPAAWINPANGLPYQLSMGWVGSTGGLVDIHEISDVTADTLSGALPGLTATLSAQTAPVGATSTYQLHVATTASGGPEKQDIMVTDTFPASVTPLLAGCGGTGWTCTRNGQTETATFAVTSLPPGTALPVLSMPVLVVGPAGTTVVDSATTGSNDVFPVPASATFVVPGAVPIPPTGAAPSLVVSGLAVLLILLGGVAMGAALRRTRRESRGARTL